MKWMGWIKVKKWILEDHSNRDYKTIKYSQLQQLNQFNKMD
jgi:hypothetical protein